MNRTLQLPAQPKTERLLPKAVPMPECPQADVEHGEHMFIHWGRFDGLAGANIDCAGREW